MPALGLLSLVVGNAFGSRTTFPRAGISLEHDAALAVGSQSAPPSARVLNVDGFPWVIGEPVCGELGRAVFVTECEAFLGDMGVCPREDGSRVRMLQVADGETVSWRDWPAHAREMCSRIEPFCAVQGHRSVPVEISSRPTAAAPKLTEDQTDREVRVGDQVRFSKQNLDIAADLDVCATTASGSDTRVVGLSRPWRGWLGLREVERLRSTFPTWRPWSTVGGQDNFRPLWHHHFQDTTGLTYVVNSNDRDKVANAQEEVNKMIEGAMRDAVVLALGNTLTPSIATRSGKKLTDVRKNEDLWWWYADGAGGDSAVTTGEVQPPASGAGRGQADMGGRGKGKMAGGRDVVPTLAK